MAMVQDRCICLRKFEYRETSQVVLLLARAHGLQRLVAKGAHRKTKAGASKFDGGIDLLDVGQAVFTANPERELGILAEWTIQESHRSLRTNLRAMYLGLYAAELLSVMIEEHDPHPELYDLLERTLIALGTPAVEEAFVAFEVELLRQAGYLPQLENCAVCGNAVNESCGFSPGLGGVVCTACRPTQRDTVPLDGKLLGALRTAGPLPRLERRQTDPINRLLAGHIRHTLGRDLRLAAYVL